MTKKEISVVFYNRRYSRDWKYEVKESDLLELFERLQTELSPLGVRVTHLQDDAVTIDVKGYGDLLNCIRIRSPHDNISNLCLGHIIGLSPNRDLLEDIRKGINRVAFAPETIEPEGSNKIVCHNCGCGC